MTNILLADDQGVVRHGLALTLNQEADFAVVGQAANGSEAISQVSATQPDLVVLDWKMPIMDGVTAAAQINAKWPSIRIVLLTGAPVEDSVLDALDTSIHGFIHKDVSPQQFVNALRKVANGERYMGPEIAQALIERSQRERKVAPKFALSKREQEVLQHMASPLTYREIGAELFISEETVRTHTKNILVKLNQPNRTQAVIAAIRAGLISIE